MRRPVIAVYQHRWFLLSGCALLHAVLHGLLGLSYLAAGAIAAAGGTVAVAVWLRRTGGAAPIQHGAEP
jgi:hypothetical protein